MYGEKGLMAEWLLLIYKLPPEPSRYRASIWRKLKEAGAIYLQQGAAALPADATSLALMRTLVCEIAQMQGTAYLAQSTWLSDEAELEAAFNAARAAEYTEVLGRCRDFQRELAKERAIHNYSFAELEENEEDLHKLETWLGKITRRDRFGCPLRQEAEQAATACRADLEDFAASVYRAGDAGEVHLAERAEQDGPASHENLDQERSDT
jgi:hypothetical protein